jgi:hypothetical protein
MKRAPHKEVSSWKIHSGGMIFQMRLGRFWNPTCQGKAGNGEASQKTTVCLLMLFFGYYAQDLRGVTSLQNMEGGEQYTSDSFAGVTKEYGKNYVKY